MNTYCDDCKRCTGGNMRKSDVPGGDDHNRCWECEATLQAGMAVAGSMISALEAERGALRRALERIRDEGSCTGAYPGENYLANIARAVLAATEAKDCPECDGAGQQINIAPGPLCGVMRICPACEGTGVKQGASK